MSDPTKPNQRAVVSEETLRVTPATHAPDGTKLEPEERPAQRVVPTTAPLRVGSGEEISAIIPAEAVIETTAGELAMGFRTKCATCRHFNQQLWRRLRREYERSTSMEKRDFVNQVRFGIAQCQDAETAARHMDENTFEIDVEAVLDILGVCEAQTEIFSKYAGELDLKLFYPTAGCPDGMRGPGGEDLAHLYQPRDRAAERAASGAHDLILRMAQGKAPSPK